MPAEQSNERVKRWKLHRLSPEAKDPLNPNNWRVGPIPREMPPALLRGAEEIEVIPADSRQVLSVEEARLLTTSRLSLTGGEQLKRDALEKRLRDFAEEADRG